jgi:hypothetical protein
MNEMVIKIGPADHGRRMSLERFECEAVFKAAGLT